MSPQGISSMLRMRMIERRHGFDPLQYCLARATYEDDPEDIPNEIPSFQEDPPSQPPASHRPVHAIIYGCHVLLNHDHSHHDTDHHDNLFAWCYDCGTQRLPPPLPLPSSTCMSFTMSTNLLPLFQGIHPNSG
ncbi:hypothetical protein GOBAR_AA10451 [Gossypium barbadense]|uniref:Uncharacterized protein n=1 Tax=Gossypium barbadense TaxID=3634 RepID=A0A2P5Y3M0_GOSBA|nr:hypothetical protein GOBAR_AA10451 [Gossypium barbadense]